MPYFDRDEESFDSGALAELQQRKPDDLLLEILETAGGEIQACEAMLVRHRSALIRHGFLGEYRNQQG